MYKNIFLLYATFLLASNGASALFRISKYINASRAGVSDSHLEEHGFVGGKSTVTALHGLANGNIPDDAAIDNIGVSLRKKGINITEEHMKIAKQTAQYLETGEGDGNAIADSAQSAVFGLASKGGLLKEEHVQLLNEGVTAIRNRDKIGVAKALAKVLIHKDVVEGALDMHKSWKQGKYVDMTGHCVTMLGGAVKSRLVPAQLRATALTALTGAKVAHKVFKTGSIAEGMQVATESLKNFESLIPLPKGALGILRRGASAYMNAAKTSAKSVKGANDVALVAAEEQPEVVPEENKSKTKSIVRNNASKKHIRAKINAKIEGAEQSDENDEIPKKISNDKKPVRQSKRADTTETDDRRQSQKRARNQ